MLNYINCTLIIQIINFWITYFIIQFLFLKPVLEVISHKIETKKLLFAALKEKEQTVALLHEKKNNQQILLHSQLTIPRELEFNTIEVEYLKPHEPKSSLNFKQNILKTKQWLIEHVSQRY